MSEKEPVPSLEDVLSKTQKVTGTDVAEGTYPGTLYGYSEPFWLAQSEKFKKPGQPDKKLMVRAEFGLRLKDGKIGEAGMMFQVPNGEIHRKSNSYKFVKALASGDPELMNAEGDVAASFTLKKLIGKHASVSVKNNEKGFPQVEGLLPPIDGAKYPTLEECKSLGSEDVPF
jgi:hypothetical protein